METKILRVVRQGEAFDVQSQKAESGKIKDRFSKKSWQRR